MVMRFLLPAVVNASPDQFPPDGHFLENLSGHSVSLSKMEGGLKVSKRQELLDQLRGALEHLRSLAVSQRHFLSCRFF